MTKIKQIITKFIIFSGLVVFSAQSMNLDNINNSNQQNNKLDEELWRNVRERDYLKVEKLIEQGANVNAQNSEDCTPLRAAVSNKYPDMEIIELLIAKGANINAKNSFEETALHLAYQNIEVIKLLVKYGADINAVDYKDRTLLQYLVQDIAYYKESPNNIHIEKSKKSVQILKFLLDEGADLNMKGINFYTGRLSASFMETVNRVQELKTIWEEYKDKEMKEVMFIKDQLLQQGLTEQVIDRIIIKPRLQRIGIGIDKKRKR